MKEQNPKPFHYVVETKPKKRPTAFKFAAIELTYAEAERAAKKLAKENDKLMVRIIEKRLAWANY